MSSSKAGKERNVAYFSGWIIASRWRQALRRGKPVLEITLRTDEQRFGGHHHLLVHGEVALDLQAVLDILTAHCQQQQWRRPGEDELDQVPPERLSELFPEVLITGSLRGDELLAEHIRYLNLSSQQHQAARLHAQQMRQSGSITSHLRTGDGITETSLS
jgi:hypothetical protein